MSKSLLLLALGALGVAFIACERNDNKAQEEPAKEVPAAVHAEPAKEEAPAVVHSEPAKEEAIAAHDAAKKD